jgi:site-specific DNA-methyltransferase (adenine-specific)
MGEPAMNPVLLSSKSTEWSTPQDFYDKLNSEFVFNLDPCATHENHKCSAYFTKEDDGLSQSWAGKAVFMNPPYGREVGKWIKKAYGESLKGATVVCLIPARTDTAYWHDYCMKGEIRFIRGRLKFGGAENSAPFPSALVIFRPSTNQ